MTPVALEDLDPYDKESSRWYYTGKSVAEAVHATREMLQQLEEAPLEAELLVRHVTGLDRAGIFARSREALTPAEYHELRRLTFRRLRREPLPYILGHWEFFGLDFIVNSAVMIPRPETETLVEEALEWYERRRARDVGALTVADVGTGSGCIAVSLASRLAKASIVALDISRDALNVAEENTRKHATANHVQLLESDLLSAVSGPLDLIVANLPYIPDADVPALQPEVSKYEPQVALGGGPDGLSLIRRLLAQSHTLLSPQGAIMLEINPPQSATLPREAQDAFPDAEVRVVKDLAGRDRVLVIDLSGGRTA